MLHIYDILQIILHLVINLVVLNFVLLFLLLLLLVHLLLFFVLHSLFLLLSFFPPFSLSFLLSHLSSVMSNEAERDISLPYDNLHTISIHHHKIHPCLEVCICDFLTRNGYHKCRCFAVYEDLTINNFYE